MRGSNTDRRKRCPISTRGIVFDRGRRSNINPATRRRDAVLLQRNRSPRPSPDLLVPAHKRLLDSERELNASTDRTLSDDPDQ